ncbi:HIT family protein [Butyrivibrio proteoclasticus]|uniref:HIT family protein n=1 Tax=Butyrivibrio proteoclasticus TaxID=43305 RepID=UPI00047CE58E|nr:HIT domain-containing protein [Butyrivibrio proteoclasticus]
MEDCIFCKLANGVFPTNSIYEDDNFKVILDNGPATKGHALVLPKQHYENLFEIPEDTLKEAAAVAKKVASTMKEKLGCDGLNLVQNNGEAAGQTVMHFHLHIIPRYNNDGQHILWKPTSPSPEELEEIKNTIIGA